MEARPSVAITFLFWQPVTIITLTFSKTVIILLQLEPLSLRQHYLYFWTDSAFGTNVKYLSHMYHNDQNYPNLNLCVRSRAFSVVLGYRLCGFQKIRA